MNFPAFFVPLIILIIHFMLEVIIFFEQAHLPF